MGRRSTVESAADGVQIRKGVNCMNDGTSDLLSEIWPWKCGRKGAGAIDEKE